MSYLPGGGGGGEGDIILGPVMRWQGAWANDVAYLAEDVVRQGSVSYVCILGHTNQQPPNATYWTVIS